MSRRTQKNLNVVLVGARGRMGREIGRLAGGRSGLTIVARIESTSDWRKIRAPRDVDGIIDFSTPEGFREALAWAVKNKAAFLSGTTGLTAKDMRSLKAAARRVPVLYSANMSSGVTVMRGLVRALGGLSDWRFAMEETHHRKKKDRPSGTAKMLAAELKAVLPSTPLKIVSYRRGRVPGTHILEVKGPDETLVISHVAHHRRIFARGAIRAARWLFDKNKPGLYDITDLYKGR